MKNIQETESCERGTLRRKIGEGSFVGFKRVSTAEELVEWLKHLYAYMYVENFAEGKIVLDMGCGTGYGTNELSTKASLVVGSDIWKEGIRYCHQNYGRKASFSVASGTKLPFKGNSFDLVVSFQVIEHIDPKMMDCYLKEITRVLKNDGRFIVSTPNKRLRLLPFQKPWNADHKKEYDAKELRNVLKTAFEKVEILGLFATKDAYVVEYYRVKQNPFFVYSINPIASAVKHILSPLLINALKIIMVERRKNNEKTKITNMGYNFSLRDFRTSRRNLESCIDLYGICVKK
jgi:ubiquinone/menaquinone biosynthesis C-methylase UbiE